MAKLNEKIHKLYELIRDRFYLGDELFEIGNKKYLPVALFGILTLILDGKELVFGEYGSGNILSGSENGKRRDFAEGKCGQPYWQIYAGEQIIIQGNAGNWIGQNMRGGLIRIRGNARDIIGKKMTGGEIVIEGDAGCWVADEMRKGIIRIQGEYGSLDEERRGGEIFQWQEDRWKRIEYGEVLGRARIC